MSNQLLPVSDRNRLIGETAPAAVLTDHDVSLIRSLRESDPAFWTFRRLGEKFEISRTHACRICHYSARAHLPAGWRRPN